jgi:hypothetical protein
MVRVSGIAIRGGGRLKEDIEENREDVKKKKREAK